MDVAFSGLATIALAGTLVVPRAGSRPGGQCVRSVEYRHVWADLGDDDSGGHPIHSWDLRQALMQLVIWR